MWHGDGSFFGGMRACRTFHLERHFSEFLPCIARMFAALSLELIGDPEHRTVDHGAVVTGQVHDARLDDEAAALRRWCGRFRGILQADAYGGYNDLYSAQHKPAPVLSALCWSHARRKFFELADIKATARKG